MACNLAVSITRAAITGERLLQMVTPEVAQAVLTAVLADQRLTGQVTISGQRVYWWGYSDSITIEGGKVTVTSGTYARRDLLANATTAALQAVAGRLLSAKLAQVLAQTTGKRVASKQVQAVEGGVTKTYTHLVAKL